MCVPLWPGGRRGEEGPGSFRAKARPLQPAHGLRLPEFSLSSVSSPEYREGALYYELVARGWGIVLGLIPFNSHDVLGGTDSL